MSPTQRTLAWCRRQGLTACVVERWNGYAKPHGVRIDAFGFADVLALDPFYQGTLYLQATSASNHAAREKKLALLDAVRLALETGNRVAVVSWRKSAAMRRWIPRATLAVMAAPHALDVIQWEPMETEQPKRGAA